MEFGLGVLKLPPVAFWRMSLREYDAAARGHLKSIGADRTFGVSAADRKRLLDGLAKFKAGELDMTPNA
jgi:hypothetical protein